MKYLLTPLLIALSATAWSGERLGFKGVELGAPLARVASDPRYACRTVATPVGDVICSLRPQVTETVAGTPATAAHYFFEADRLTSIQITLAEKDFQAVTEALAKRYGVGSLETSSLQNPKGERFENKVWTWKRGGDSLRAERYSGRLDRSDVRINDEGAATRVAKRRANKDPSQDL